ncbi:hypothetical protein LF1_31690 [Rubripirellula obstinata]|uniref:Uncharacterized protein n=1 Tax=Rubripirellula obstinata TaxID=406547 RepID=A0A5B1CLG6_9BACT|nr:hypothetical protein [Rubripirellula obstinata]KAA1260629.1 hypothetical protein LF1_31690 [Rubripirellula obstinata]
MKRNELTIWAMLITSSVVGSIVAAALPNPEAKSTSKQVQQAVEVGSDEAFANHTLVTTRSKTKSDASSGGRFAASKSF